MIHVYDSNRNLFNHITLSSTPPLQQAPVQDVYCPEGQACLESCLPTGPLLSGLVTRRVFGGYFIVLPISSRKGGNYEIRQIRDYLEENNERRNLWTVCFLDRVPAWLPSASGSGNLTTSFPRSAHPSRRCSGSQRQTRSSCRWTDHNRVDIFRHLALGKALFEHIVAFLLVVDISLPGLATIFLERVWYIALWEPALNVHQSNHPTMANYCWPFCFKDVHISYLLRQGGHFSELQ